MDQDRAIPMIGPDVQELPPRVLRERLDADEQLIWWSKGRGVTLRFVPLLVVIGGTQFLISGVLEEGGLRVQVAILGVIALLGLVLVGGVLGARFDVYGLTNRRILFVPWLAPTILPLRYSLGRDSGSAGAIHMLDVTGNRDRGNIRLQTAIVGHGPYNTVGVRLLGVNRPLDVAKLIQSTLDLPIPIEDRTR